MKFQLLFIFILFFFIGKSQEINPKLIGNWESEMIDAKKEIEYYVLIKRFEDGFFDSLLMIQEPGKGVEHYAGTGKWWTIGDILYLEYHQPDTTYSTIEELRFEILADDEIRIQSKYKERPKILRDYIERKFID